MSTFWKYIPDGTRWIQMTDVDESSNQFEWQIDPVQGQADTFTIKPAYDTSIVMDIVSDKRGKYQHHGMPVGFNDGRSARWTIKKERDVYSKVSLQGTSDVLDCDDTTDYCVHFATAVSNRANQCWVFQLVG